MRKRPVCFFVALSSALWGLWLLNPFVHTFANIPASYYQMSRVAPEEAWGVTFVISGLLLMHGVWKNSRYMRMAGSTAILMLRLFTLVLAGIQNRWATPGTPDFAVWTIMAFYCLIKAHDE